MDTINKIDLKLRVVDMLERSKGIKRDAQIDLEKAALLECEAHSIANEFDINLAKEAKNELA